MGVTLDFAANARTLIANPGMIPYWTRWLASAAIARRRPSVTSSAGVAVRNWISFSEYWGFRDGIPAAHRRFMRLCAAQTKSPLTAFDVGANVGLFALELVAAGFDFIHAFEPVERTFLRLTSNVGHTGVEVVNAALGDSGGSLTFAIASGTAATNHILTNAAPHDGPIESVRVLTLDEYCATLAIDHIDLLKIDVEGMEPSVLRGGKDLMGLRAISQILIEVCPENLTKAGTDMAELYQTIVGLGYAPFELRPDGSAGARISVAEFLQIKFCDLLLQPIVPE